MVQDVNQRQRTEEPPERLTGRLQLALRSARVGTWTWDIRENRLAWDEHLYPLFGLEPSERPLDYEFFLSTLHPDDRARVRRTAVQSVEDGVLYDVEFRVVWPNGSVHTLAARGEMQRDDRGEPVCMAGVCWDITARKQAEEALRKAEDRSRGIWEALKDAVGYATIAGRLLDANEALARLAAYSRDELPTKAYYEFTLPDHQQVTAETWDRVLRTSEPIHHEKEFVRKDGSRVPVSLTVLAPKGKKGQSEVRVAIIQDLTEQKRLEEQFRQSQKMEAIGRLAGGIAHDFNNLLTVINGYSEILLPTLDPGDERRVKLEQISTAGQRAAALTNQLLAFSRRQVLVPKVLDLNAIVSAMDSMLQRLIGEDTLLVLSLDPALGPVKADPSQLEQDILNLVVNARDAMPHGGRLSIETANVEIKEPRLPGQVMMQPGRYVMLAVSDTGFGMDAATQARIFEPFFTTKEKGKGTGLGLSTVYETVKQCGGTITVYSEPGHGATFKIYLPRVDEVIEPIQPTELPASLPQGTGTVLLVEDEPGVRALARDTLRQYGYTVLEARHGIEALVVSRQYPEPIDLLITDVIMPQMSGRQLADRLAATHPELKVLYMSGYTDNAIVDRGVLDPGTAFLHKPFSPAALVQKVRAILDAGREKT